MSQALSQLGARVANKDVAHRCRQLAGDFVRLGVVGPRPSRAELASDQIARNESADRLMIALARMVFDTMIPSEYAGSVAGNVPDANEHLVRRLFERAIGNALRLQLQPLEWRVKQGSRLSWPVIASTPRLSEILPGMQTDIELTQLGTGQRIVIDTKFTQIFTSSSYRSHILKSGYLYQLYSYLRTQERSDEPRSLDTIGMLLHPQTGEAIDEEMLIQGHHIRFLTIDLTGDAADFEKALRDIGTKVTQLEQSQPMMGET